MFCALQVTAGAELAKLLRLAGKLESNAEGLSAAELARKRLKFQRKLARVAEQVPAPENPSQEPSHMPYI